MKKKLAFIVLSFFVLLGVAALVVFYKLNDIVSGLRPQIEQQLSTALDAPIQLGPISVALFPRFNLSVKEIRVLATNDNSTELSLGGISASVALRPLLSNRLDISNLAIERPRITLIKDSSGFSIKGLRQKTASGTKVSADKPTAMRSPKSLEIAVSRINILNGEITVDDRLASKRTPITAINLDGVVSVKDGAISVPTVTLSFLASPLPQLRLVGERISYQQDLKKFVFGSLKAISEMGALHLAGEANMETQQSSISFSSNGIDLRKIPPTPAGGSLTGSVTGNISAIKGSFSGPANSNFMRSAAGAGDLAVKDILIKGVNLGGLILQKISNIPLLEGTLRANIAPEHQRYFNDPDTRITELKSEFTVNNGAINLKSLRATSDGFALQSSGTVLASGELDLSSNFILNSEISKSLASRSKTIEKMLTKDRILEIPVLIKGKSPALIVTPDISKLLQGAGGQILQEQAANLLDKVLGGNKAGGKKNPLSGLFGIK